MSLTMRALRACLTLRPNRFRTVATAREAARNAKPPAAPPRSLTRKCEVISQVVDGMTVFTLTPLKRSTKTQLLYIHGGGFVFEMIPPHWQIIQNLIRRTGATVTVPYYPLAPTYDATFTFPKLVSLYTHLRSKGSPVFVAGDSAGGTLALSLAIELRDTNATGPDALFLFSPFVDASATNPEMGAIEPRDPLLAVPGVRWVSQQWAGPLPLTDSRVNPASDHLRNLPPLYIYQGGCDIFAPDAKLFHLKASTAGTQSEMHFYPDGFHVFVGAPFAPESQRALSHAASVVNNQTPKLHLTRTR